MVKFLRTPKSTNNILFNKATHDLTNQFNIFTEVLTIFNLRQKVCICIYTPFDIRRIYKSLKSWSAITLNLNKQN